MSPAKLNPNWGRYLVKVIKPNIAAESFDGLRYVIDATSKTNFYK